jgi:RHS repeat-associated protein
LDLTISLGKDLTGRSAGSFSLHLDQLGDQGSLPPALTLNSPYPEVGGSVMLPNGHVATVSNSATGWTVWFKDSGGGYLASTSLNCANTTNLTNNTITIVTAVGDPTNTRTVVYSFLSTTPGQWTWTRTEGDTVKTLVAARDSLGNETNVITIADTNGVVATITTDVYAYLPSGRTLIQQTLGTGSAARTTQWIYAADTGFLTYLIQPTGYWEYYQYDAGGRMTNRVSQFGDNPTNTASSQNRVQSVTYEANGTISTVDSLLGTEVGWTEELHSIVAANVEQVTTIRHADTSDTNGAVISVLWRTTADSGATNAWATMRALNPDGTMQFYSYSTAVFGGVTNTITIVQTGAPNSGHNAVADGTIVTTVVGGSGEIVSNIVQDAATGIFITQDSYAYSDLLRRSYTVTHLDGTTESVEYEDCCGIDTTTDRDGVTTTNLYDTAKRLIGTVRLGITQTNWLDAAGNVLLTFRVGRDASTMLLDAREYDSAGQLTADTNALGGVTTYSWAINGSGQTVYTTDNPDGGTILTTNHADGTPLGVGGSASQPVSYLYGVAATNSPFTVTRKMTSTGGTNEWSTAYQDMLGRVNRTVYAAASGAPTATASFSNLGQLTNEIDPDGVTRVYGYDDKGVQDFTVVDLEGTRAIDTNGTDRVTQKLQDVYYDSVNGNVLRTRTYVWNVNSSNTPVLESLQETSTDGLKSWTTVYRDTNTPVTSGSRMVYAGSGYRYQTNFAPNGAYSVSTFTNGILAVVAQYDSGNNQIGQTLYGHDAHGRQNTSTDARDGTTTTTFNAADQPVTVTTPVPGTGQSAEVTTSFYDTSGRLAGTELPDGTYTTNLLNPTGTTGLAYGSREYPSGYSNDVQGRMTILTNWTSFPTTGSRVTTWNYDQYRGWLASKVYDDGHGPLYSYTGAGRLNSRLWARGTNTTYTTNTAGDVASVSYSDSTPGISNTYDREGRKTNIVDGSVTTTLTFNDAGQQVLESYAGGPLNGISVSNGYDSYLRRTTITIRTGSTNLTTTYGYDNASRLASVSDGTDSAMYSYLANSPLVSQIAFKQSSTTRMTTTKQYDYLDRLTSISSVPYGSSHPPVSFGYGYNAANQRTTRTDGDGPHWNFGYDSLGQVTNGTKNWADNNPVPGEQFAYGFDNIGNRVSTASGGNSNGASLRSATYSVNDLNQYTSRTVPNGLDDLGIANYQASVTVNGATQDYRRGEFYQKGLTVTNSSAPVWLNVTNTATYSGASSNVIGGTFVPQTPESYTYDADGNLTLDGHYAYTWDAENRLVTVTDMVGVPYNVQYLLNFTYDYLGRRIQKIVSTNNGMGSWVAVYTNKFIYDGWNPIAVLDGGNNLLYSFAWGTDLSGSMQGAGGVSGVVSMTVYSGASAGTYFYSYDGNGNVTAVVNATAGAIAAQYEYGPFGEVIRATGPMAKVNPLRFSTKYQDDETGLLYYGYRYYNPSTGRWLNRDPLGDESFLTSYSADKDEIGQMLLRIESLKPPYTFALNQPVTAIDSLGLDRWEVNWIHSWVIVEVWDKCCQKVVGYERIEFTPRGGWGAVSIFGTLGFVAPGEVVITSTTKPSGWAPNLIPSSCAQDWVLLEWAKEMAADPPLYSFWVFNCRHFAAIAQNIGLDAAGLPYPPYR